MVTVYERLVESTGTKVVEVVVGWPVPWLQLCQCTRRADGDDNHDKKIAPSGRVSDFPAPYHLLFLSVDAVGKLALAEQRHCWRSRFCSDHKRRQFQQQLGSGVEWHVPSNVVRQWSPTHRCDPSDGYRRAGHGGGLRVQPCERERNHCCGFSYGDGQPEPVWRRWLKFGVVHS